MFIVLASSLRAGRHQNASPEVNPGSAAAETLRSENASWRPHFARAVIKRLAGSESRLGGSGDAPFGKRTRAMISTIPRGAVTPAASAHLCYISPRSRAFA